MKLIQLTLIIVVLSVISASKLMRIPNVEGPVTRMEFDSKSNTYIVTRTNANTTILYQLNPENEVVKLKTFIYILKIIINSEDDLFIFEGDNNDGYPWTVSIWKLPNSSTEISLIYKYPVQNLDYLPSRSVIFIDNGDNISFNTAFGVEILKRHETLPKAIDNLDNIYIVDEHNYQLIYRSSKIIIAGSAINKRPSSVAVLMSYDTNQDIPSAVKIENPNSNLDSPTSIEKDSTDGIYFVYGGNQAKLYRSRYLDGGSDTFFELLLSYHSYYYSNFYATEERFYLTARDTGRDRCYLFYGPSNQRPYLIDKALDACMCTNGLFASDSLGTLYLAANRTFYSIKKYEKLPKMFPCFDNNITSLIVDGNDNVLLIAGSLFMLPKDSTEFVMVSDSKIAKRTSILKIKDKSNEILIGTDKGLYVYFNVIDDDDDTDTP